MRTFIVAILVFVTFGMGVPAVRAQTCSSEGAPCSYGGGTGICINNGEGGFYCNVTNQTQTGVNTSGTQTTGVNTETTLINPLGSGTTLNSFLISILNIITNTIGPVIVILMLVYVGFKFVMAQGSDSALVEARKMLLWTLIGALILLGAKAIAIVVQATVSALGT
jgi:hypothetical protein